MGTEQLWEMSLLYGKVYILHETDCFLIFGSGSIDFEQPLVNMLRINPSMLVVLVALGMWRQQ